MRVSQPAVGVYAKFPFVTNHHKVIKDHLMLIFCVWKPTAIKRQQHSVSTMLHCLRSSRCTALTSSVTQRWTHLCENSESDECAAYLLIEQQCGAPAANKNAIPVMIPVGTRQRQGTLGKGKLRRPVGGTIYANVIWPGMKWKYATR